MRKGVISKSRSRSRGQQPASNMSSSDVLNLMPTQKVTSHDSFHGKSGAQTVKMYDGSDESAVPAWYKVLKKNFSK